MDTGIELTLEWPCDNLHTLGKEVQCPGSITGLAAVVTRQGGGTAPRLATHNTVACVLLYHKAITCTANHNLLAQISTGEDPLRLASQVGDITS